MAKRKEVEQQAEELQMKVASLEEQVRSLQGQLQSLQQQIQTREQEKRELLQQIDQYRSRENTIVLAMTDAREAGARKLQEAQEQARVIVAKAEEDAKRRLTEANWHARDLEKKAKTAELDATRRAQKLVEDVQADISRKFRQVECDAEEFQQRLERLNQSLNEAVAQARQQAESFANALKGILFDTDELSTQGKGLSALIDEKQEVTPKEYGSAAQFMHDIYKLQGRDIPEGEADAPSKATPAAGMGEQPQEPAAYKPPEPPSYKPEPSAYKPSEPPAYKPEPSAYKPPEPPAYKPEPSAYKPPEPPAYKPEPQGQEERVWTVDEIIAGQKPANIPANSGGEGIDLDSLLDEIMN